MRKALQSIEGSLTEPDAILEALLNETMQCWLIVTDDGIIGFCTTQINMVEPEHKEVLLVRDLYSLNGIPDEVWVGDLEVLTNFAKSNNCSRIIAYTKSQALLNRVERLGFDIDTVMISKEV
jgi:hypothetical protein